MVVKADTGCTEASAFDNCAKCDVKSATDVSLVCGKCKD